MSAAERVSAAANATAAAVREIRPLVLPDASETSAEPRRNRNASPMSRTLVKMKETWMIPLGAAAAVTALALSLVAVRHAEPPRPATPSSSTAAVAGIPRYYAVATVGKPGHIGQLASISVTVADVRTDKAIATVALPAVSVTPGLSDVGVTATRDDRAFVVSRRDESGDTDFFLVNIVPGAKQVATFGRLPIPQTKYGNLLGFAVSPDGMRLATLSVRGNGTTVRIYSAASGAILRTWVAATWHNQNGWNLLPGISWTADGRQVAFSTMVTAGHPNGALVERLIGATAPSGDLAAVSKVLFKAPGNCASLLLTPDGGTVVCATKDEAFPLDPPVPCGGKHGPMFLAYSAATGKLLRVLYTYTGPCVRAEFTVLWTDNAARHVVGEAQTLFQTAPYRATDRYGVAAGGKFVKFPVLKPGRWDGGPAF